MGIDKICRGKMEGNTVRHFPNFKVWCWVVALIEKVIHKSAVKTGRSRGQNMKFVDKLVMESADEFVRYFLKCKHAHQVAETFILTCKKSPLTSLPTPTPQ